MNFNLFRAAVFIVGLAATSSAWAGYYDVLDNAEILPKGTYKLTGDAQILTETGGGNVGAKFDMGIPDEFGVRALAGFGKTDYYVGGLFKWIPIPDVENQPAVGGNVGLVYAKWKDGTETTFRFEPLVSKKFITDQFAITPYGSIPIGLRMFNSNTVANSTEIALQFVAGAQLQIEKWKKLQFMAEVGLDLDKALSHVSVAAVFYFDEQSGFELK